VSAASCPSCHSWGVLYSGACRGCYDFARRHEPGPCGSCHRRRPLKEGHCRNCWLQAALQAAGAARRAPDLGPANFAAVRWHQLSFAGVARMTRRPRLPQPDEDPGPAGPPGLRWEQPELPAPGQSLRFHARHWTAASVAGPALEQARAIASRLGEARGWNPRIQAGTARALAVMLASHAPGETIPWSALEPALRPRGLSVSRTAEILSIAGLLDDDRVLPLTTWAEEKLATLAPGIAACARNWTGALLHGTPRSLPRNPDTARGGQQGRNRVPAGCRVTDLRQAVYTGWSPHRRPHGASSAVRAEGSGPRSRHSAPSGPKPRLCAFARLAVGEQPQPGRCATCGGFEHVADP